MIGDITDSGQEEVNYEALNDQLWHANKGLQERVDGLCKKNNNLAANNVTLHADVDKWQELFNNAADTLTLAGYRIGRLEIALKDAGVELPKEDILPMPDFKKGAWGDLIEAIEAFLPRLGACTLDHGGACQGHFLENPCSVDVLRKTLEAKRKSLDDDRT